MLYKIIENGILSYSTFLFTLFIITNNCDKSFLNFIIIRMNIRASHSGDALLQSNSEESHSVSNNSPLHPASPNNYLGKKTKQITITSPEDKEEELEEMYDTFASAELSSPTNSVDPETSPSLDLS